MANRISVTEDQVKAFGKLLGQVGPRALFKLNLKALERGAAPGFGYHSGACIGAPNVVTVTCQRQTVNADATGTIQNPGSRGERSQHGRITIKEQSAR
ncbi:hypothetical protein SBV1_970037 [Verrucomicrobia bacterium]|nr:hypothetical protein SBV1_970037 [Verrucomicrobiota bacterium]